MAHVVGTEVGAETLQQALEMLAALGDRWELTPYVQTGLTLIAFFAGPLLLLDGWTERRGQSLAILEQPIVMRGILYLYFILMLLFFPAPKPVEFIYFQF